MCHFNIHSWTEWHSWHTTLNHRQCQKLLSIGQEKKGREHLSLPPFYFSPWKQDKWQHLLFVGKKAHCFSPQTPTLHLWLQYQMHSLTMPSHWIGEGDLKEVVIFRQESFHYGCQTCGERKRVNNKNRLNGEELTSIFHQYCLGFIQPGFITDAMHFTQMPGQEVHSFCFSAK